MNNDNNTATGTEEGHGPTLCTALKPIDLIADSDEEDPGLRLTNVSNMSLR